MKNIMVKYILKTHILMLIKLKIRMIIDLREKKEVIVA
jgi:hypothetical protein